MNRSTDDLIASLAADAMPVRRLPPPNLRAAIWLSAFVGVAAVLVLFRADLASFAERTGGLQTAGAWLGSLATGVAAVIAAAHVSLPDRSRLWALLPLPFLLFWVGLSGLGCLGLPPAANAESDSCLVFILASGVPVAAFLLWRLSRARPLEPGLVGLLAALGAAGLSAALLQFFHPFAITWLDLALHLGGVAVVTGLGALAGRLSGLFVR